MIDDFDHSDDGLAGEFVLGTLSAAERAACEQRVLVDPAFADLVASWRVQLEPLDASYRPASPQDSVKSAIDARLFGAEAKRGFWSNLWLWRGLAAAGLGAALVLTVLPTQQLHSDRLLASLADPFTGLTMVAIYDRQTSVLKLNHVAGGPDPDHDYELWVIAGENPPASLGLVSAVGKSEFVVPVELRPHFTGTYTLAISDEPAGGSPTGAPTGAVVAADQAVEI